MNRMKKNVWLLSFCQALMNSGNVLLVATSSLVGYHLAANKALATLPLGLQFLGTMLTTIPASMFMKHVGRRAGFIVGVLLGTAAAAPALPPPPAPGAARGPRPRPAAARHRRTGQVRGGRAWRRGRLRCHGAGHDGHAARHARPRALVSRYRVRDRVACARHGGAICCYRPSQPPPRV